MTRQASSHATLALAAALLLFSAVVLHAHSGPPFPILENRVAGAYSVSIWSDPDSTDDGSAQGKFWVVLAQADGNETIPAGTTVHVTIHATDRRAASLSGTAAPADGLITRQFVSLLMDHEGPFSVHVVIDGPLGHAEADSRVDATYQRPPGAVAPRGLPVSVRRDRRALVQSDAPEETGAGAAPAAGPAARINP